MCHGALLPTRPSPPSVTGKVREILRNMMNPRLTLLTAILSLQVAALAQSIPATVERMEYVVPGSNLPVWVYLPKTAPKGPIPCVLIAAAGTRCFHGLALSEGDIPEHTRYAEAGFAAVAYSLSGPWPGDDASEAEIRKAVAAFLQSGGGFQDAVAALKLAGSKHAVIDTGRVYLAGHSSAATVALTIAQRSKSIRGCLAYAPITDLHERIPAELVKELDGSGSALQAYLNEQSPLQHVAKVTCPVFLFVAEDDSNVAEKDVKNYAAAIVRAGGKCRLATVKTGDHYDAMIESGIDLGIAWIKAQEKS